MIQEGSNFTRTKALASIIAVFTAIALCFCINAYAIPSDAHAATKTVDKPTADQIKQKYKDLGLDQKLPADTWDAEPVLSAPYSPGYLSLASQNKGVAVLNLARFIAGIPSNVTIDSSYAEYAQAAALVNCVNNELSHYPAKPDGMSDEVYNKGYAGAQKCNLASGWSSPADTVELYMNDSDDSNIALVGHRRWCLDPLMGQTGFGRVGNYGAMYSMDQSNADGYGYDMVSWPAATMPIEFFGADQAWSVSLNTADLGDDIKVELIRENDGKVWSFSSTGSDGYFNINKGQYYTDWQTGEEKYAGYGYGDAIIFRPDDLGREYQEGDCFTVKITGSTGTKAYAVQFFDMDPDPNAGVADGSNGSTDADQSGDIGQAASGGTWVKGSKGWWYRYNAGGYAQGLQDIGSAKYYFDSNGWMKTGWQQISGTWYYFKSSGAMATGWQKVKNTWYLFAADGKMQTGWQNVGGSQYYLSGSGAMKTGWQSIEGSWYHFKSSGVMNTGWLKTGGKWYLLATDGKMLTGWQNIDGTQYYLNGSGAMKTGWLKDGSDWYYLANSGAMKTGWQKVSGKWYLFASDGKMQTGWQQVSGTWYYFNGSGVMKTGWLQSNGNWYYLNGSGAMQTDKWIGNYYVGSDGVMARDTWIGQYYVDGAGKWVKGRTQSSSNVSSEDAGTTTADTVIYADGSEVYHTHMCASAQRIKSPLTISLAQAQSMGLRLCANC